VFLVGLEAVCEIGPELAAVTRVDVTSHLKGRWLCGGLGFMTLMLTPFKA
jgi:hypothetical protein